MKKKIIILLLTPLFIFSAARIDNRVLTDDEVTWFQSIELNENDSVELMLAENNIDVNITDSKGNTGLHVSVSNENLHLTELLIKNRADLSMLNNKGQTVLDLALLTKNTALIELIRKNKKSETDPSEKAGNSAKKIERPTSSDSIGAGAKRKLEGTTSGVTAQESDEIEPGSPYSNLAGSSFSQSTKRMRIALGIVNALTCGICNFKAGDPETLITHNGKHDLHNSIAWWLAVKSKNYKIIRSLLLKKINVNIKDEDGDTALHIAIRKGDKELIMILIKANGIALNLQNKKGETAKSLSKTITDIEILYFFEEAEKKESASILEKLIHSTDEKR